MNEQYLNLLSVLSSATKNLSDEMKLVADCKDEETRKILEMALKTQIKSLDTLNDGVKLLEGKTKKETTLWQDKSFSRTNSNPNLRPSNVLETGTDPSVPVRNRRSSITIFREGLPESSTMINHGNGNFVFSVGQYNLLAEYVGSNKNPWFLYGANLKGPEGAKKREKIMKAYYAQGPNGRSTWPEYVKEYLSPEEIEKVESIEESSFLWEKRAGKLLETIKGLDVDILSLVELDHYELFSKELSLVGYDSIYAKRPRAASKDGCGVFWKRDTFYYVSHSSLHFVDEIDSKTNMKRSDRCCVCVLLRSRFRSRPVIFVSVHLARNPENYKMDKLRGKQLVQLLQLITSFTRRHKVVDAPVVVCGDINAVSLSKLRGIAGAAAIIAQQRIHPFLWRFSDVPSLPTSVTNVRAMRVDTILFLNTHLQLIDIGVLPVIQMEKPIPDENHPSDHLPVKASFRVKSELKRCKDVAREWWAVTSGEHDSYSECPLDEAELRRAYMIYDYDGTNTVDHFSLSRGISLLQLFASNEAVNRVLANGNGGKLGFEDFCVLYLQHEGFSYDAMSKVFTTLDTNNSGSVSKRELGEFLQMFEGTQLFSTEKHIDAAIELASTMDREYDDILRENGFVDKITQVEGDESGITRAQFGRCLMVMYARLYFSPSITNKFKEWMVRHFGSSNHKISTLEMPGLARTPSLKVLCGSPRRVPLACFEPVTGKNTFELSASKGKSADFERPMKRYKC